MDCGHKDLPQSFDLKPLRRVGLFAKRLTTYELYFDILQYPRKASRMAALRAIRDSVLVEVQYLLKNELEGMAFKMEVGLVPGQEGDLLRWALRFKRV